MENRSKSVLGAMLADDDISLEPFLAQDDFEDRFFIDSEYILEDPKSLKNGSQNEVFCRRL